MIDHACKGHRFTPVTAPVEAEQLHAFFRSIGETNPAVTGPDQTGRVAIPPTYLFCLEMLHAKDPFGFVNEIGISIEEILHANQSFTYHHPIHIGDTLTYQGRVSDVFDKKNGQLTFVIEDLEVTDQNERLVAESRKTFVIRNDAT